MIPDSVLSFVAPQHRQQFLRFVETQEASPAFLKYLNRSARCQLAVERVLRTKWEELAHLFGDRLERSKI